MPHVIWTVGHSTRPIDDFLRLLTGSSIGLLVDVRKLPGSTRHPQFNREALEASLKEAGIAYRHAPEFGGRRGRRAPGSPNTAWKVDAFNAFADHMATPEFTAALDALTALAAETRTAIMCSEAVPWRCHRRLIADALIARGWEVFDIVGPGNSRPHALTEFARVESSRVTYPSEPLFGTEGEGST